jgi:hypothetical protein
MLQQVSHLWLSLLLVMLVTVGAGPIEPDRRDAVTGILEQLDLTRGKGELRTDLGKPIFFEIAKPELFKELSIGKRVTIELDAQGRAMKVIAVPAPEQLEQPAS